MTDTERQVGFGKLRSVIDTRPIAAVLTIAPLVTLLACAEGEIGLPQGDTGIVLEIGATTSEPFDRVTLTARNRQGDEDTISVVRDSVADLAGDPLLVLLHPSFIATLDAPFLVCAKGFRPGSPPPPVMKDASLLVFTPLERIEYRLTLRGGFVDQDDDCFEPCPGPSCDCDDQNPGVNHFRLEICGNAIDEDCSGSADACL